MRKLYYDDAQTPTATSSSLRHNCNDVTQTSNCFSFSDASRFVHCSVGGLSAGRSESVVREKLNGIGAWMAVVIGRKVKLVPRTSASAGLAVDSRFAIHPVSTVKHPCDDKRNMKYSPQLFHIT